MKTKLLFTSLVLWSTMLFAQTDGWYQIDKPQTVNAIVPDDIDPDIIHLATNIGYIKYNTSTNQVVDFLNVTSQNPAIGNVSGLALNPTNNEIALALSDGVAIYNGTTVTKYTYDNSDLTVGSSSGTELRMSFGVSGELYLFKSDVFGYQVFNSGAFNVEVATSFRPQDIEENHDGTKIFFAGWNDGLHEYTKASTSWVNYTTSNSDLIYNPLEALYRDASGKLYVGGFQGFNTIDSSETWETFQQMIPSSAFFYPAFDFSKNSSGNLMVVTSKPNVAYNGLCLVEEGSNTWTRYYQDGTNCLNSNTFTAVSFGGNDKIYASPQVFFGYGKLVEFVSSTDTCTDKDINYLNAPEIGDYTTFFTVRNKTSGGSRGGSFIELAYKDNSTGFGSAELNPPGFNGQFISTQQTPAPQGDQVWSIQSHNETLFCETNDGILFINGDDNQIPIDHNIPNFYSTRIIPEHVPTASGVASDVINVIIQGVQNGLNKLFKTQCTKSIGSCTVPEEIVLSNIDNAQPIKADLARNSDNETVLMVAKTNSSGNEAFSFHKWLDFLQPKTDVADKESSPVLVKGDPKIVTNSNSRYLGVHLMTSSTTGVRFVDVPGGTEIVFWAVDANGQIVTEEVVGFTRNKGRQAFEEFADYTFWNHVFLPVTTRQSSTPSPLIGLFAMKIDPNNAQNVILHDISNSHSSSYVSDMVIFDTQVISYESNKLFVAMLTNYGFLLKTDIDVSHLLSNEKFTLTDPLRIFPNPSNNQVSFNTDKISSVIVYDINGRKVLEKEGNSFSVKTLAKGVYIVKGQANDNIIISKKLIVN